MSIDSTDTMECSLDDDRMLPEGAAADLDMDSMHILPLGTLPIETQALKRARLIKNVRLESMVELFHGDDTGSGQVSITALRKVLDWPEDPRHPDDCLMHSLSALPSFDVYSLRLQLRKLGIDTNATDNLKLSDAKLSELTVYMKAFTLPLIRHVYGNTDTTIDSVRELIAMFASPDRQEAIQNLKMIA